MNVDVNEILDCLANIIQVDRAQVQCEVYKGATQLYLRFHGIARILSARELKDLLDLAGRAEGDLYVVEIPPTSHDKQGVKVSLGIGPVVVTRTAGYPLGISGNVGPS